MGNSKLGKQSKGLIELVSKLPIYGFFSGITKGNCAYLFQTNPSMLKLDPCIKSKIMSSDIIEIIGSKFSNLSV